MARGQRKEAASDALTSSTLASVPWTAWLWRRAALYSATFMSPLRFRSTHSVCAGQWGRGSLGSRERERERQRW